MTLTNNQHKYRTRKEKQKKDFTRTTTDEGKTTAKVNTKRLCVRVSMEASEKLKAHAADFGLTRSEMLTHILNVKTDTYLGTMGGHKHGQTYVWKEELIEPDSRTNRRKAGKQEVMLSLDVSSTAYKNLKCHANNYNFSMARLVEAFIINYVPVPKHVLQKHKDYLRDIKEAYANRTPLMLTAEQAQANAIYTQEELARIEKRDEERWARLTAQAIDNYDHLE